MTAVFKPKQFLFRSLNGVEILIDDFRRSGIIIFAGKKVNRDFKFFERKEI